MAQRLDLERLELTGGAIRVAEGVQHLGMTAGFAVAGGALVHWSGDQIITQPTWFQRDGTVAGTLGSPGTYMNVALSPNGRQVAINRFDPAPGIWLLDPARGTATRATSGAPLRSTPVWSPDGTAFVFAAARDTPPNLYLKRIGTAGEEERLFRKRPSELSADAGLPTAVTSCTSRSTRRRSRPISGEFRPSATGSRRRCSKRSSMKEHLESRPTADGWPTSRTNPEGSLSFSRAIQSRSVSGRCPRTAGIFLSGAVTVASSSIGSPTEC